MITGAYGVLANGVAPLVGAWIEIAYIAPKSKDQLVAPLVGAWIEIKRYLRVALSKMVAPLVGAWIEIPLATPVDQRYLGRSPCGSVD